MSSSKSSPRPLYHCIECLEPCDRLYRQYTESKSSIKLTTCRNCHAIVDPYIEREWLLVVLDCVLLRITAYRHVLYNRLRMKRNHQNNTNNLFGNFISLRKAIQCVVASAMLGTYLKWEALLYNDNNNTDNFSTKIYLQLFLMVFLEFMALWCTTCGMAILVLGKKRDEDVVKQLLSRLFLAFLLPTTFNVVVVLVLIWENTPTVRLLGSLCLVVYQCMGVSVTMQEHLQSMSTAGIVFLMGLLLRTSVLHLIRQVLRFSSYPCVGLEVPIWLLQHPLCVT